MPRICQFCPPAFHVRHVSLQYVKLLVVNSYFSLYNVLDEDATQVTSWEAAFIVFAVSFTLAEYTSSTEHGWISALFPLCILMCPS